MGAPPQRPSVYVYHKLGQVNVSMAGSAVHVWGIVVSFRSGDHDSALDGSPEVYLRMCLFDESQLTADGRPEPLFCQVFAADSTRLPQVSLIGDIVRLHRVRVVNSAAKGVALSGYVGRAGMHAVVCDPLPGGSLVPRHSTGESFTFGPADAERLAALRNFWRDHKGEVTFDCFSISGKLRRLNGVPKGFYYNLLCQVVGVARWRDDCAIIRVWDASKPTLGLKKQTAAFRDEAVFVSWDEQLADDIDFMTADVYAWNEWADAALKLTPGQIVYMTNVHSARADSVPFADGSEFCMSLHAGGADFERDIHVLSNEHEQAVLLRRHLAAFLESSRSLGTPAAPRQAAAAAADDSTPDSDSGSFITAPNAPSHSHSRESPADDGEETTSEDDGDDEDVYNSQGRFFQPQRLQPASTSDADQQTSAIPVYERTAEEQPDDDVQEEPSTDDDARLDDGVSFCASVPSSTEPLLQVALDGDQTAAAVGNADSSATLPFGDESGDEAGDDSAVLWDNDNEAEGYAEVANVAELLAADWDAMPSERRIGVVDALEIGELYPSRSPDAAHKFFRLYCARCEISFPLPAETFGPEVVAWSCGVCTEVVAKLELRLNCHVLVEHANQGHIFTCDGDVATDLLEMAPLTAYLSPENLFTAANALIGEHLVVEVVPLKGFDKKRFQIVSFHKT